MAKRKSSLIRYDVNRPGQRRCSKRATAECQQQDGWWPLAAFRAKPTNSDGLHSWCTHCERAAHRAWMQEHATEQRAKFRRYYRRNRARCQQLHRDWLGTHQEAVRAYSRQWRKDHPVARRVAEKDRKIRLRTPTRLTDADWAEVLRAYGDGCLRCGATEDITIDHVVPPPTGPHDKTNVQPLCRSCNSKKGRRHTDYRPDKGRRFKTKSDAA